MLGKKQKNLWNKMQTNMALIIKRKNKMFQDNDWFDTPEIKKILASIFDDIEETKKEEA